MKAAKTFQKVKKQIFDLNLRGKCPFCMISEATTLDHYFPESIYPEYIIFVPNLVPCCNFCNIKKGDRLFKAQWYI